MAFSAAMAVSGIDRGMVVARSMKKFLSDFSSISRIIVQSRDL
jgi:hypothetical protein